MKEVCNNDWKMPSQAHNIRYVYDTKYLKDVPESNSLI